MNLENFDKVCVVGLGKSGYALCDLLLKIGKKTFVTEAKTADKFPAALINRFKANGVVFEFGGHSEQFIKQARLLVLSPGVDPAESRAVAVANRLGIPCVGEVEFAFWLTKAKFVALTGTNGKSTTTFLTYRVLKEKLRKVFLGGNIGIPVSSFILDTRAGDLVVLEISSFQLETIIEFRPLVAAFLNIDPNHLDRHPSFEAYLSAKLNIFRNQKADDFAVLKAGMGILPKIEPRISAKKIYFCDEFADANQSCVFRIAEIFGAGREDCQKVFTAFKGLPHRMQTVGEVRGVCFINDSKSTNPSSTIWALKNIDSPLILIAGGKDKGVDYRAILPYAKKVKAVHLFGAASAKIEAALSPGLATKRFSSLEEVVKASLDICVAGDTVLFSPMCSSFDMFTNYMERGRQFTQIVQRIADSG